MLDFGEGLSGASRKRGHAEEKVLENCVLKRRTGHGFACYMTQWNKEEEVNPTRVLIGDLIHISESSLSSAGRPHS